MAKERRGGAIVWGASGFPSCREAFEDEPLMNEPHREGIDAAFLRYRGRLRGIARRIVGNDHDADDVVSEAFLALLERQPPGRADGAEGWLVQTAKNRAVDRLRARKRETVHNGEDHPDRMETGDGPVQGLTEILNAALDELPNRYREALRLRYVERASFRTIGEAVGCSPGQARVVLHRARRTVRGIFIRLLARKRGVDDACAAAALSALKPRVHCEDCRAFVEEIVSMPALGVLSLSGLGAMLDRAVARLGRPIVRSSGYQSSAVRVAETMTVVMMLVAGVAPVPPAGPHRVPAAGAARVASAAAEPVGRAPRVIPAAALSSRTAAPLAERIDDEADSGLSAQMEDLALPALGAFRMAAADPIDQLAFEDLDITRLTIAGDVSRGRPMLTGRLELANAPSRPGSYVFFGFSFSGCSGGVRKRIDEPGAGVSTLSLTCWSNGENFSIPVKSEVSGLTSEFRLALDRLPPLVARYMRPGVLVRVRAGTERLAVLADSVPDDGDIAFRMPALRR